MKKAFFTLSAIAILNGCTQTCVVDGECEIATWPNFATAAVSYTFDDNLPNQFSIAVPLLEQYGFCGSFYPIVKDVDNWDMLCKCSDNGHEIGSHTINHLALSTLSPDSLENELAQSKEIIEHNVIDACLTMVYPYCNMPDTTVVARHYIGARVCDNHIEPPTPRNYYAISSFGIGSESAQYKTAQSVIDIFDNTRKQGGWCVLLVHEIEDGFGYSPFPAAAIDSTLSYLAANTTDFWVATFANVIKYTRERDNVKIELIEMTDKHVWLSFTTTLDSCYDMPLSVRRQIPSCWNNIRVKQNGRNIDFCIADGYVYFDVVPNCGDVTIKNEE